MSKFFAKNEDTSSSEEESDKEEQVQTKQVAKKKFYVGDSDNDDDEEQRVVKKKTDQRNEGLMKLFDTMKNHIRIMDFTALQSDFDDIQTELGKCVGYSFATDKL